jgi:NitT/TauT family transport system permease protein
LAYHQDNEKLHRQFLEKQKKIKRKVRTYQLLIFILFVGCWELASTSQFIDPLIFSSPSKVLVLLIDKVADGSLFSHLLITIIETIFGFLFGTILGTTMAATLWWFPTFSKVSDPYLVVLNAMPKVALGPIFIVVLGPGMISIIGMGMIISVVITTLVVYSSFKEVDENYIKMLKTFGARKRQIFTEAILPASFPTIISTLKVNVGLSWIGVIVGEFLVSNRGLGYLIIYGFQVFNFTLVLLALFLVALFATLMYQLVHWVERVIIKDRMLD